MTKREMAEAMLAGKRLTHDNGAVSAYWDEGDGFVFQCSDGSTEPLELWHLHWTIQSEPRYMTRDEVLGFLANTPGIVVRYKAESNWFPAAYYGFEHISGFDASQVEYATIDLDGNIGTPQEFRR